MVNNGVELIVDGCIYVYVLLCGCVLVGVLGNMSVCIFVVLLEVELVFIVGVYWIFENGYVFEFVGK